MERPTFPVGPVDVARHEAYRRAGWTLRVLVDGRDVTRDCRLADDTPGRERAVLLLRDAQGDHYVDPRTGAAAYAEAGRATGQRVEIRLARRSGPPPRRGGPTAADAEGPVG